MKITPQARQLAKQLFRACLAGGTLDAGQAQLAAHALVEAKHRNGLAILSYFHHLVKMDRDEHTARIESAGALDADLQRRIQAGLERMYGRGLESSFTVNPALLGGLRIRVGSDVFDGSVQGRLAALEDSF